MDAQVLDVVVTDTVLGEWRERDRQHVCLSWADRAGEAGPTIVEWWDDAADEAVLDGILDARDLHGSAFAHAASAGLLRADVPPLTYVHEKVAYVAVHPERGAYMGWEAGGAPRWSSVADETTLARGAYAFSGEEAVAESFEEDRARVRRDAPNDAEAERLLASLGLDVEVEAVPVGTGIPVTDNRVRSRVSVDECLAAGIELSRAEALTPR